MQIVRIKPQKFWQESAKAGGAEKESLISLKHFRIMVGPFKALFEKTEQWTAADELNIQLNIVEYFDYYQTKSYRTQNT